MTASERLDAAGPKRILSLDGGGIRGAMTIEILADIECHLRRQTGNDSLLLGEWFDFIGGTSTGAILAAALSIGMSTSKLREFYEDSGEAMFDKAFLLRRFRYKYEQEALAEKLREVYGASATLGSDRLLGLLMLVLRNATTDSPWPLSNNPRAVYNDRARPDCNLDLPLWQLVRASTAAPTYFPPEEVTIGARDFLFVDGGVTMYNNPAFQMFLMATLPAYRVGWVTGEDKLLIVSVGTGHAPDANADLDASDMNLLYNAASVPSALMSAALHEQDLLCRVFGNCLHGDEIDREVGDLRDTVAPGGAKLFTYVRYNALLTQEGLAALDCADIVPTDVQSLDSTAHIASLQRIGRQVAAQQVREEHFENFVVEAAPAHDATTRQRYRRRADTLVTAIRIDMSTSGIDYDKWGGRQHGKRGDWLVCNGTDVYTVDAESFAQSYRKVSEGRYEKYGFVWAQQAVRGGSVATKEGASAYDAGDYIVSNDEAGQDSWAVSAARFHSLYEQG